jgi:hypothetical protein
LASTRAADPFDDELVPLPLERVLLGQKHRHPIQMLVAKFDHPTAYGTDQVLVVRLVARRLESTEPFAEVALHDESGPDHDIERTVYRRGADRRSAGPELSLDLLGGDVPVAAQNHLGDGLPLRSHRQVVVAQVGKKRL